MACPAALVGLNPVTENWGLKRLVGDWLAVAAAPNAVERRGGFQNGYGCDETKTTAREKHANSVVFLQ